MPGSVRAVQFDTKLAVVLRDDLAVWQKTNVAAFLVSGIAATEPGVVGEPYRDAFDLVVIAFRADRKVAEKVVDRLRFHP